MTSVRNVFLAGAVVIAQIVKYLWLSAGQTCAFEFCQELF